MKRIKLTIVTDVTNKGYDQVIKDLKDQKVMFENKNTWDEWIKNIKFTYKTVNTKKAV